MDEEHVLSSEFIIELFRLSLHDNYIQQIVTSKLQENWLVEDGEKEFLRELKYQVTVEQRKPTFGSILLAARTAKPANRKLYEYGLLLKETKVTDPTSALKSLENFIKQAMFIELYDKAAEYYNKGQREKAYKIFTKGSEKFNNFSLTTDMWEPIFGNFPQRNAERIIERSKGHEKRPTGIDELDYELNGGPEETELMCFIAEAKGGKSFCLTHCGVNYARRGYGVAHFALEGTRKQCNARYDSNWSGSLYHDIKAGEFSEQKFESYRKIINNIGKGEIWVYAPEKFGAMTVLDLRRMLIDLKKKRNIDVVIIDYADLLNPDDQVYKVSDERFRQEKVMQMLKDLAMELKVLIITATQATIIKSDETEESHFVIRKEHLAEAKGKVRAVDYLISINRTREERRQGICRLFLDSIREHDSDKVITICQSLKRARFFDRKRTLEAGFFSNNAA